MLFTLISAEGAIPSPREKLFAPQSGAILAPALARGLAKLPISGNFDWGSPNILPPALRATPLINAGGKGCVL